MNHQTAYMRKRQDVYFGIFFLLFAILILIGGWNSQEEQAAEWYFDGSGLEKGAVFQEIVAEQAARGRNRIRQGKRSSSGSFDQIVSFLPVVWNVLQKPGSFFIYQNVQNQKRNFKFQEHIQRRGPPFTIAVENAGMEKTRQ